MRRVERMPKWLTSRLADAEPKEFTAAHPYRKLGNGFWGRPIPCCPKDCRGECRTNNTNGFVEIAEKRADA